MRNVITRTAVVCLCAYLLGSAGCDSWQWPPSWSQNDGPAPDEQPAVVEETAEQRTIRTQAETIGQLTAENEQLQQDIVWLSREAADLKAKVNDLEFALNKQTLLNESLNDAIDERDDYRTQANDLAEQNLSLSDQVELLKGEINALHEVVADLNAQNRQLLESWPEDGPSPDDGDDQISRDNQDDPDGQDDEARSQIHFGN